MILPTRKASPGAMFQRQSRTRRSGYTASAFTLYLCRCIRCHCSFQVCFSHSHERFLTVSAIIKELGFTAAQAQLLTVPPYAFAFILTISAALISERLYIRTPFIIGGSCLAILGYILLLTDHKPAISYLGTIFAAGGIYPATALVLAWPATNVSGQTKRATANAMQISIGNLGAVLGTQLYRTESAPRFYLGHGFAMGYLVANICVVSVLYLVLKRENTQKENGRQNYRLEGRAEDDWLGDEDPRWRFQL